MAGKRKPNPTHITRYERESWSKTDKKGNPWRTSNYDHGIAVGDKHLDEIRRNGFVRIEETWADTYQTYLDQHPHDCGTADCNWSNDLRQRMEEQAARPGLYSVTTMTVGHIVWPGDSGQCEECPFGP